jgi:hypothetical protein
MKRRFPLLLLALHLPVMAVQEPTISVGDFLFVRAKIVGCELYVQTLDYGEVDENGEVLFLDNISLSVEGKAIHRVVEELVDELESRTGYRTRTIEIQKIPGSDSEGIAKRLLIYTMELKNRCIGSGVA